MSNEWEEMAERGRERRERLLSFGAHAEAVLVSTENGLFAVNPEDAHVSASLLQHGSYAQDEIDLVRSFIAKGDVLVVGSHIGAHVVALSRLCRDLVAIEANPETFKLLEINLRLNGCSNVTAHNVAAGEANGSIQFVLNRENSGGSKRMPGAQHIHYFYDDPQVADVVLAPLDDLVGTRPFDLILMDIEGSEYFALKGMSGILSQAEALAVEFLPHHLVDVAGVQPEQFVESLLPHFSWLYIPSSRQIIPHHEIAASVRRMFDAGEGHNLLIFSRGIPQGLGVSDTSFRLTPQN